MNEADGADAVARSLTGNQRFVLDYFADGEWRYVGRSWAYACRRLITDGLLESRSDPSGQKQYRLTVAGQVVVTEFRRRGTV